MPPFETTAHLKPLDGISHGFFGRRGGTSTGIYDSLNAGLGSGDSSRAIIANRKLIRDAVGAEDIMSCHQVHGDEAITVSEVVNDRPQADGMVTAMPGIALCILTADCVPVLFADRDARVIGAAHAGWSGALKGICASTLDAMEAIGATRSNIIAAIGPAIQQASYEVGPEFRDRFNSAERGNDRFFVPGKGDRYQFDLTGFVEAGLRREGLAAVDNLGHDTCALEQTYFSNRRRNHRGEPDYGRNASVIVLNG